MDRFYTDAWRRGKIASLKLLQATKRIMRRMAETVEHGSVISHLAEDGGLSVRYCVMIVLSCAIAILGLLLSSPAVVIGAMLLSPLMTPIVLFGFSLTILDRPLMARSLLALAAGIFLAVAWSALIVWLSPLQAITPEILARTRPNFFDLLVAFFSGAAGAYAVSQHKGETLVGVAIATALMPPLAVVGFGLATLNWAIFSGAGGLFMTNMLVIGLTASLVAKLFGFAPRESSPSTIWYTASIVAVFTFLSIPLGLSLKHIADEAIQTNTIRSTLNDYFTQTGSLVYGVKVTFPDGAPIEVEALVLVKNSLAKAEDELRSKLTRQLKVPVQLALSQVPMRANASASEQAVNELKRRINEVSAANASRPSLDMPQMAALQLGVQVLDVSTDSTAKTIAVHSRRLTSERLTELRKASALLEKENAGWRVELRLDGKEIFPSIVFSRGSISLDTEQTMLLDDIAWALGAAQVDAVSVTGFADTSGKSAAANRSIAIRRARTVAGKLEEVGMKVVVDASYPIPGSRRLEQEYGREQFRRATIVPLKEGGPSIFR